MSILMRAFALAIAAHPNLEWTSTLFVEVLKSSDQRKGILDYIVTVLRCISFLF